MLGDVWLRWPFLRIIVPLLPGFVIGRLAAEQLPEGNGLVAGLLSGTVTLMGLLCLWWGFRSLGNRTDKHFGKDNSVGWGILLFFLLLFFAVWRSYIVWSSARIEWPSFPVVRRVLVTDVPRHSSWSVNAEVRILGSDRQIEDEGRQILLSFRRDSLSEHLRVGDVLWFKGRVYKPVNRGNPEEFDYAEYLAVKGLSGRSRVEDGNWCLLSGFESMEEGKISVFLRWKINALLLRDRLLGVLRSTGVEPETAGFLAALALGDKSALSPGLRDVYTGVGVSHVLALSGMHLAFLTALLNLLLLRYTRRHCVRCVGAVLVLMTVWGYTFLAGFPPSLLRASYMYSLMLLGLLLGRSGFTVNSLAVSATVMLCLNPLYLYDVGFRLSFLAMAGILFLYPRMSRLVPERCPLVMSWALKSLLVSLSAQLFTVPLVAWCFGNIAPYSALATLLITPFTVLLLYGTPLLLFLALSGWGTQLAVAFVDGIACLQNGVLRAISQWPGALVTVDFTPFLLVVCYALLCIWLLRPYMSSVRWWKIQWMVVLLFFGAVLYVCSSRDRLSGAVFYNNPSCPALHLLYSSDCSYLFSLREDSVEERMAYATSAFWRKKLTRNPKVVTSDFKDDCVEMRSGLVRGVNGFTCLVLSDDRWERVKAPHPVEVDYLYVCRGFWGNLAALSTLFRPRCVVLDASLWPGERKRFIHECGMLQWEYYDMVEHGALKVVFNEG